MSRADFDAEVAGRILNLRRGGVPFDVIATQVDLTPEACKALFDKALGSHDPAFSRALEADRLDRLHAAVWPAATRGEPDAVDRVLRISERRERVARTPKANDHALRDAFDRSTETSRLIHQDLDAAILEAGRKIADRVDEAVATGEGQELTKALYLIPHMTNVLREMLATPASRRAVEEAAPTSPREGKLAQLRSVQGAKKSS